MLPRVSAVFTARTGALAGLGMAGSALLAVAAYLAGALPSGDPGPGLRTGGPAAVPGSFLIGLACWLVGLTLLSVAWWRLVALLPPEARDGTVPVKRVLAIGLLWALPVAVAPALGSRDVFAYACQGWLWTAGLDPYAMGVADGGCPWTSAVPQLWWSTPTPYGPFAVLLSGLAAAIGQQLGGLLVAVGLLRLLAVAAAIVIAVTLPRLATACRVSPAAAIGLGLVTPLLLLHGVSAAHNDVIVTALVVAALAMAAAHPTDTPVTLATAIACGTLLAGAIGIKVTALVAVPFVLILLGRRWAVAAGTAVVAFIAGTLATGLDLGWVEALRDTGSLVQWSSPPTAVGMVAGYLLRGLGQPEWVAPAVAVARAAGLLLLAVIGVRTLWSAWRGRADPPRVVLACGVLLAATALLGPVFYPWYVLAPLAVLAASLPSPRGRRWLAAATVACAFLVLPNGLGVPVLTKAVGAVAVTAGVLALLVSRARPRARA